MKGEINIDTLHAFIMRDNDGTEGLAGVLTPNGWLPLVAADATRVAQLEPIAQQIADANGKIVSLVHFTQRDEIRTFEPNRQYHGPKGIRLGKDSSEIALP